MLKWNKNNNRSKTWNNVINKFQQSLTTIPKNRALWLDVAGHMTNNQLDCIFQYIVVTLLWNLFMATALVLCYTLEHYISEISSSMLFNFGRKVVAENDAEILSI